MCTSVDFSYINRFYNTKYNYLKVLKVIEVIGLYLMYLTSDSLSCKAKDFLWCKALIPLLLADSHSIHILSNPHANTCRGLWVSIWNKNKSEIFIIQARERSTKLNDKKTINKIKMIKMFLKNHNLQDQDDHKYSKWTRRLKV